MKHINNDKYYTPIDVANKCIDYIIDNIDINNLTDIIEPSVGNGAFLHHNILQPNICYDIEPEIIDNRVIKVDFLNENIEYKQGRLVLGNPPFGIKFDLGRKFYNKATEIADYIGFILPISQYNNSRYLHRFDLIASYDLGNVYFSDRHLHCCFNIYKRPTNGNFNRKPKNSIKGIKIYRRDTPNYKEITDYDVRLCAWGNTTLGKILQANDKFYAIEYKIKIDDYIDNKSEIIEFLKNYDYYTIVKSITANYIKKWQIIEILKENFKQLR